MPHPGYEDDEFWKLAIKIPDEFKLAIADLIISFGRLEVAIDLLIWWAARIDSPDVGRAMISRLDIRPKCEMALKILNEMEDNSAYETFKQTSKEIETATKRRNAIIHGWWAAFGSWGAPMSTRGRSEPGSLIGGKPLTITDIQGDTERVKSAERSIHKIIDGPAPAFRKHSC